MSAHYRKQLNFTWASLGQAEEALRRLTDFLARLDGVTRPGSHPEIAARVDEGRQAFAEAMQDDLNTAAALGAMFELVRALNSAIDAGEVGAGDVPAIREAFDGFDRVLGVLSLRRAEDEQPPVPVDGDRAPDRGAACRPAPPRLRRRRSHSGRPGGSRRAARGRAGRHALEDGSETLDVRSIVPLRSRPTCPGPKAKAIIERDRAVVSPSYTRGVPVRHGARRRAPSSRTSTATCSSTARPASPSTATGHSHPDVVRAVTEQAQRFLHMSGTDFYYEPQVKLAEELAAIAPIEGGVRSFFGNSGAEAIEACIKLSRYATRRTNIIAFLGGVSRPDARRALADGEQGDPAPRVRSDDAGRLSRAVSRTAIAVRSA